MPNLLTKIGGVGGISAAFEVYDDGSAYIKSASGSTLWAISSAGAITQKGALTPAAGGTAIVDATNCATGEADIVIADNKADAFTVRNGSTPLFTLRTTDNDDRLTLSAGLLFEPAQTIDMNDTTHALVIGAAATAGQTRLTANLLLVDPNSGGASEILKLPALVSGQSYRLTIFNTGGESIVVQTSSGGSVGGGVTIHSGGYAQVGTDGTSWGGKAT